MTSYPVIRLEADGLEALTLDPEFGWFGQRLDLGDPVTRDVAENAPDADGSIDTTAYVGARPVTLGVTLYPEVDSLWTMRQRLKAFTSPRLRPTMFLQMDADAPEQQLTLRRSRVSDVFEQDETADLLVQWVAPKGILESAALHEAVVMASGDGSESGVEFDLEFDLDFGSSDPIGSTEVVNAGTVDAYPVLRLYGPCTEPVIENVTQDRALTFSGLTVAAGEYVEIDTRAKTIRYLSDPADSRYDNLDFPVSRWWTLSPGVNVLRFNPATGPIPAQVVITWRDAWL